MVHLPTRLVLEHRRLKRYTTYCTCNLLKFLLWVYIHVLVSPYFLCFHACTRRWPRNRHQNWRAFCLYLNRVYLVACCHHKSRSQKWIGRFEVKIRNSLWAGLPEKHVQSGLQDWCSLGRKLWENRQIQDQISRKSAKPLPNQLHLSKEHQIQLEDLMSMEHKHKVKLQLLVSRILSISRLRPDQKELQNHPIMPSQNGLRHQLLHVHQKPRTKQRRRQLNLTQILALRLYQAVLHPYNNQHQWDECLTWMLPLPEQIQSWRQQAKQWQRKNLLVFSVKGEMTQLPAPLGAWRAQLRVECAQNSGTHQIFILALVQPISEYCVCNTTMHNFHMQSKQYRLGSWFRAPATNYSRRDLH